MYCGVCRLCNFFLANIATVYLTLNCHTKKMFCFLYKLEAEVTIIEAVNHEVLQPNYHFEPSDKNKFIFFT